MTVHLIKLIPDRYNRPGANEYDQDGWLVADQEFWVPNRYQRSRGGLVRSSLHFSGPDEVKNRDGRRSQEPYAYLVPLAVVIARHPLPQLPAIALALGDWLVAPEHDLILRVLDGGTREDTGLEIYTCRPRTVDHSAFITRNPIGAR